MKKNGDTPERGLLVAPGNLSIAPHPSDTLV